jgi:hypothetical protein
VAALYADFFSAFNGARQTAFLNGYEPGGTDQGAYSVRIACLFINP